MAKNYRPVNRDQLYLVPPDLRDWLPADHLAWFLLEVVSELDLKSLHDKSKRGGVGREGYDPAVLLVVWLYASARGISSSRQIERACSEDVAFRVLCAQDVPDHTVLAKFRQRHQHAIAKLFAQVLLLCVAAGLGKFGVIAIDGTKIRANASKEQTRSLKVLRAIAKAVMDTAEATDAAEDATNTPTASDDLPPGMGPGAGRKERIRAALAEAEELVETENRPLIVKAQARLADAEARLVEDDARLEVSRKKRALAVAEGRSPGRSPGPDSRRRRRVTDGIDSAMSALATAQAVVVAQLAGTTGRTKNVLLARNTTDLDSRVMRTRHGFEQSYNAQLGVSDDQLILAAKVTNDPNDVAQYEPMMDEVTAAVKYCKDGTDRNDLNIGMVVVDNGYLSEENVTVPGPDRLIAPGRGRMKDGVWVSRINGRSDQATSAAAQHMIEKLAEPGNQAIYARRSVLVEPVNGHLKDRRGLRQFSRRGLPAVQAELEFAAMTSNLMKLFTQIWQPARTAT